jgi:hypothetical protein
MQTHVRIGKSQLSAVAVYFHILSCRQAFFALVVECRINCRVTMQAIHQEVIPASGVEFATCLKLLPSTLSAWSLPSSPNPNTRTELASRALFNVVVARSDILRIFEVREEPAPISPQNDDERERKSSVRRGTEAVEGEVEMDEQGEGFVNIGTVKVNLITRSCYSTRIRDCFAYPTYSEARKHV